MIQSCLAPLSWQLEKDWDRKHPVPLGEGVIPKPIQKYDSPHHGAHPSTPQEPYVQDPESTLRSTYSQGLATRQQS